MGATAMKCPCCREKLRNRTTKEEVPCFKNIWLECTNFECGATFAGHQVIVHQLRPSGLASPFMQVPMAPTVTGKLKPKIPQGTTKPALLDKPGLEQRP
ncbi:ogr/Delta-like zinc finger family protein (plasmid) [Pseudomonas luteola]|nr:ogr/Delta-like zinc finger family protein [Pseudomonas luteola]